MRTYPCFTLDHVLYQLSYANLMLLSSVIPSYNSTSETKSVGARYGKVDADNPANKDQVLRILSAN